ncbi:uncharacterized protein LOC141601737 [Silene latifolia]|uniref:uncharacterized protein LOC141601737 n=1 Tax=Silene latifolia TaxID=37657 RepID=UPI003D781B44
MVRFKTKAAREAVLKQGHFLFDNKPLIVNPWTSDTELVKHEVKYVPVWVKLHRLPLKFWGKGISKIYGLFGTFIKCDLATEDNTRIGYARVLIELTIGNTLRENVKFLDENGNLVVVAVEFEWKPVVCSVCKGIGHYTGDCRKAKKAQPATNAPSKQKKQVWRPKTLPAVVSQPNGNYSSGPAPARPIVRLSRQEIADEGYTVHRFGQYSFLESLNKYSTPKVGIGISGSVPHKCINMKVTDIATSKSFFVSMVYAFNALNDRLPLWEQLRKFAGFVNEPWMVCGDFNCVLSHAERLGGESSDAEIDDFQRCLDQCGLVDSPALGAFYT